MKLAHNLPLHPKLKRGFAVVPIADGIVLLRSADRSLVLRGEAATEVVPRLCPLLDGNRTVAEIAAAFEDVAAPVIEQAVGVFAERDLLEEVNEAALEPDLELGAFFAVLNNNSIDAEAMRKGHVLIIGGQNEGKLTLGRLYREALSRTGVGSLTEAPAEADLPWGNLVGANCDLVMFLPDRPLLPAREAVHKACLEAGVKLSTAGFLNSTTLVVGPTVVPGETACWTCHELRVKGVQNHYPEFEAFQQFLQSHPEVDPVGSRLPALAQALAGLAAFETIRILTNVMPPVTYGAMVTLNCMDMAVEMHDVLKLPRCPVCGPVRHDPQRRIWAW